MRAGRATGNFSFKYDPFGRRIYKSSSSGTSIFLYDGPNLTEEVDQSGNVLARYAQEPGIDQLRAELRSGTTSYYQQDALNSVTSLSNSTGALTNTYTYDSFGKLIASGGSLVNPFRYTTRDFDPETNLNYYRARYDDPAIGRFISEDPRQFSAGINFYSYVLNSPSNYVDPTGLSPSPQGGCADCPGGRWVSGAVAGEAGFRLGFLGGGGSLFAGVFVCTSNPTFNVPFVTVCGYGAALLTPRPPLTMAPRGFFGVGAGLGGAGLTCSGITSRQGLAGSEGGWFVQVGPGYYFRERGAGGGGCQGAGVELGLGLGGGGLGCKTYIGDSIGGAK